MIGNVMGIVLAVALQAPAPAAAPAWSPDGAWLVYTLAAPAPANRLPENWLVRPEAVADWKAQRATSTERGPQRLWATRIATGESALLESSTLGLTSPAWSPDGLALAYGRIVGGQTDEAAEPARFEVVIRRGLDRADVLLGFELTDPVRQARGLSGSRVAWSPDGSQLVVPDPEVDGLALVRVETGRRVKSLEHARAPVWSPDGTRLAFYREGATPTLEVLDALSGTPRRLCDLPLADRSSPPVWSRDGQSVRVARIGEDRDELEPRRGPGRRRGQAIEIIQIPLQGDGMRPSRRLAQQPIPVATDLRSIDFTFDADGEVLFLATNVADQASQVSWILPRQQMTYKRFPLVDDSLDLSGLALDPTGQKLALRIGGADTSAPVGVCDLQTGEFTPLVPDLEAAEVWTALLVDRVAGLVELLDRVARRPSPTTPVMPRLSLLPAPGEASAASQALATRLQRMGRIGRQVIGAQPDLDSTPALIAARLAFAYLRESADGSGYREAHAALERITTEPLDVELRDRLACLRAQIDLGLGELDRAQAVIAELRSQPHRTSEYLEETGYGPTLTTRLDPTREWLVTLEKAIDTRRAAASAGAKTPGDELEESAEVQDIVLPGSGPPDPGRRDTVPLQP
jgi:hypothetical protein